MNEPPTCARCGDEYSLRDGMEETKYCDPCAPERVSDLEPMVKQLADLQAYVSLHITEIEELGREGPVLVLAQRQQDSVLLPTTDPRRDIPKSFSVYQRCMIKMVEHAHPAPDLVNVVARAPAYRHDGWGGGPMENPLPVRNFNDGRHGSPPKDGHGSLFQASCRPWCAASRTWPPDAGCSPSPVPPRVRRP